MNNSQTPTKSPAVVNQATLAINALRQKVANMQRRLDAVTAERDALRSFLLTYSDPASDINHATPEERAKRVRRILNKTFN